MTWAQIVQAAARRMLDDNYELFNDVTHYWVWAKEAEVYLASLLPLKYIPDLKDTHEQTLTTGVEEYAIGATDFLRPIFIYRENYLCTIVDENMWHTVKKNRYFLPTTIQPCVMLIGKTVYVAPVPTGTTSKGLKIIYVKYPAALATPTVSGSPTVAYEVQHLLIDYAVYMAKISNNEAQAGYAIKGQIDKVIKNKIQMFGAR